MSHHERVALSLAALLGFIGGSALMLIITTLESERELDILLDPIWVTMTECIPYDTVPSIKPGSFILISHCPKREAP